MTNTIVIHDLAMPLRKRLAMRKHCGPYQWTPTAPGKGRGFYQDSRRLECARHGSTFRLRLELANDHLEYRGSFSLAGIHGYYADSFQDQTVTPIIARLTHGRGYFAGHDAPEAI